MTAPAPDAVGVAPVFEMDMTALWCLSVFMPVKTFAVWGELTDTVTLSPSVIVVLERVMVKCQ